jgi:hypothetical protein
VATLAGEAALAVAERFARWREIPDAEAVDHFCRDLRENSLSLPVVYFSEWIDRWSMGDVVPGPNATEGRRFQAACLLPEQAVTWAGRCGRQFPEQRWLAARLQEATAGLGAVTERYAVVVIRGVTSPSATDEEVKASLGRVPAWLLSPVIRQTP